MSESTETPVIEKGNIRKFQGKEYDITDPRFVGQSKNAIKRILRDEIWEESRQERTKIKRDKQKRKRDERKQLVEEGVLEPLEKKPRAKHMSVGNVGAILDCGFSSYMNPKVNKKGDNTRKSSYVKNNGDLRSWIL
jgi:tRNA (guanine9-N1)-methyltransferase